MLDFRLQEQGQPAMAGDHEAGEQARHDHETHRVDAHGFQRIQFVADLTRELEHLRSRSYDTKQKEFLSAAVGLATKVADEFKDSKARHES